MNGWAGIKLVTDGDFGIQMDTVQINCEFFSDPNLTSINSVDNYSLFLGSGFLLLPPEPVRISPWGSD